MRASNFVIVFLVVAVAVTGFAQDAPVQTTRDDQGIWFIEGGSLYDVYEAMGYAVATDRMFQIDSFRRSARGTMSELLGANFLGADSLSADILARNVMYSDDELTDMFNALSDDGQTVVQAYVDGINRRVNDIYGNFRLMPFEYWAGSIYSYIVLGLGYNMLPAPWTTNDVLAWLAALQRNFDPEAFEQGQIYNITLFQTWAAVYPDEYLAMFADQRWVNDPAAQTMIPDIGKVVDITTKEEVYRASPKNARIGLEELADVDPNTFPDLAEAAERIRLRFENLEDVIEKLGATVKMGSYAWAISGDKTASGNPMVYSGPQMGWMTPSIVAEGSIRGGGIEISGMTVPGVPGILIGRTPHHAWSMQVGHAHTQDWFIDAPQSVFLDRVEMIYPAGGEPVPVPIYRTHHGPIVDPFPYDPDNPPDFAVSWAYAPWGHEADIVESMLDFARAESMEEFDAGVARGVASQHFTYADRDGNIAYWMSGWDPIRAPGVPPFFPQIGDGNQEWTGELRPRVHDENTAQGYYGGWNNKASLDYNSPPNTLWYNNGPFHRAQVVEDYLSTHDDLTFEEVRDLALNIATTDSFMSGGNPWNFVAEDFAAAVAANSSPDRDQAIAMLDAWDGHFVAGGPAEWRMGTLRADAWVLQDAWITEVLRLTFEDEFMMAGLDWASQPEGLSFNVLLHVLAGPEASLPTFYDWFQDKSGSGKPTTAEGIIVQALDNVIADMGLGPYNAPRLYIVYGHTLLGALDPAFAAIHATPYSSRSTYAHVVEYGEDGPLRIESMFPLGESGQLNYVGTLVPTFDANYFSMAPAYDPFMPRPFPLFE